MKRMRGIVGHIVLKGQDLEKCIDLPPFSQDEDLSETDGDNHSQERIGP